MICIGSQSGSRIYCQCPLATQQICFQEQNLPTNSNTGNLKHYAGAPRLANAWRRESGYDVRLAGHTLGERGSNVVRLARRREMSASFDGRPGDGPGQTHPVLPQGQYQEESKPQHRPPRRTEKLTEKPLAVNLRSLLIAVLQTDLITCDPHVKDVRSLESLENSGTFWNPSSNRFVDFWARDAQGREWSLTMWHRRGQLQLHRYRCHWPVNVCRYQKETQETHCTQTYETYMNFCCCGMYNWQRPTKIVIACRKTHPTLCACFLSAA